MKKFEFELNEQLYKQALLPVRNKRDLIILLIHAIKVITTLPVRYNASIDINKKMILYIDKMSRLIFCVKDKIFTFQFPLQVYIDDNNYIKVYYRHILEIDSLVSSLLLAIFNQDDILDGSLENINERILQEIIDNEWEGIDEMNFCELIKHFILFEPGYLRYDHDMAHMNGDIHPEHHIDFFFSSQSAIKLGLYDRIEEEWMIDLLNTLTSCKYIS